MYKKCTENYSRINGVEITAEILEKCGFNRDIEGWYLSAENKLYGPMVRNGVGGYSQDDTKIFGFKHFNKTLGRGVKYLHQLQNLYFALTGFELEVAL